MNWQHRCSIEWMRARQHFLTASDIKELLPVTATGRTRKVTEENYLKVYARKQLQLTSDDCISTGAAARGHILEPYAIEMFNALKDPADKLYHWDDAVIHNSDPYPECSNTLAFSPDACDIEQGDSGLICMNVDPIAIGEIKSYGIEKHFMCGFTNYKDLEERWQIATAMATRPSIERAYIIFYHPGSKEYNMFWNMYTREDLDEEIDIVKGIESAWIDFLNEMNDPKNIAVAQYSVNIGNDSEERIKKEWEARQRLNP